MYKYLLIYSSIHLVINCTCYREVAIIDVPYDMDIEILQSDLSNDDNLPNYNDDDNDTIDSGTEPKDKGDKNTANLFISQQVIQNITITGRTERNMNNYNHC